MLHAVFSSDWHLGSMSNLFYNNTERHIREIHKPYKYALQKGIKNVIVPGDISDTPFLDYHTHIQLISLLMSYDNHINTYYICGNHDFSKKGSTSLDFLQILSESNMFKGFKIYKEVEECSVDGTPVRFLPYPEKDTTLFSKSPHLNIGHVDVNGCKGDNGRIMRVKEDFKQKDSDFLISGHIHLHQHLKRRKVLYVGNLYQKNFGESLPKGFLDVRAKKYKGRIAVKYEFIDSKPEFSLRNVVINSVEDFAKLDKSDNIRYKIHLDEDVILPQNIRADYPNIVNIVGRLKDTSTREELISDVENSGNTIQRKVSITKGLKLELKRSGLNKKEISTAVGKVKEALNELNIS